MTQRPRLVVGMSGSCAPQYGIALLQTLQALGSVETHLVSTSGFYAWIDRVPPALYGTDAAVAAFQKDYPAP